MIRRKTPIRRKSTPAKRRSAPVPQRSQRPKAVNTRKLDAAWAKAVKERAGLRCERCGSPATPDVPLDGHHILSRKAHPEHRHNPGVGVALCRGHHQWAHLDKYAFLGWLTFFLPDEDERIRFVAMALARREQASA